MKTLFYLTTYMQTVLGKASKKEASKTSPWSVSDRPAQEYPVGTQATGKRHREKSTFHFSANRRRFGVPTVFTFHPSLITLALVLFLSLQQAQAQVYSILYNTTTKGFNLYAYSLTTNTWTEKAAPPVPLNDNSGLVCVGAYLYCSAFADGAFLRYDILQDSWSVLAKRLNIPNYPTWYPGISFTDGTYIYTGEWNNSSMRMIDRYNIGTNTWDRINLPTPLSQYTDSYYVIVNGKMYGVGPTGVRIPQNLAYVFSVFKYDSLSQVKTMIPNYTIPAPDYGDIGRMVVVGGTSIYYAAPVQSQSTGVYSNYFGRYNTLTGSWTKLAPPPFYMGIDGWGYFNMASDGSNIYAMNTYIYTQVYTYIPGWGNSVYVPSLIYKYNIATNSWSSIATAPAPNVFLTFGVVAVYAKANQSLTVTPTTQTANKGEIVTYTYTLSNTGGFADGVTAKVKTPAGLTLLSATAQQGSYNNNTKIWDVGTMGEGSKTLVMKLKVD